MLNWIWFALMAIALVVAAINGTAAGVTKGAVDSANTAARAAKPPACRKNEKLEAAP